MILRYRKVFIAPPHLANVEMNETAHPDQLQWLAQFDIDHPYRSSTGGADWFVHSIRLEEK
jgi:hypothetical protein